MDGHRSLWPVVLLLGVAGCAGTGQGGVSQAPLRERPASRWFAWRGRPAAAPGDGGGNASGDEEKSDRVGSGAKVAAASENVTASRTNRVTDRVARFFPKLNRHDGAASPPTSTKARPGGRDLWADSTRVGAQARLERWRENARKGAGESGGEESVLPVSLEVRPGPGASASPRESRSAVPVGPKLATNGARATIAEPGVVPASAPPEARPVAVPATLPEVVEAEPRTSDARSPAAPDLADDPAAPPSPSPADTPPPPEAPAASLKPAPAPEEGTPATTPRTTPAPEIAPAPPSVAAPPRSTRQPVTLPPAESDPALAPVEPSPTVDPPAQAPAALAPGQHPGEPTPSAALPSTVSAGPAPSSSRQAMIPMTQQLAPQAATASRKGRLRRALAALTHRPRGNPPQVAVKTLPMPVLPSKQMPGPIFARGATPGPGTTAVATGPAGRPRLASTPPVSPSAGRISTLYGPAPLFPAAYYADPGPAPYHAQAQPTNDPRARRVSQGAFTALAPTAAAVDRDDFAPTKLQRTSILARVLARLQGGEEVERHPAGCPCGKHPRGASDPAQARSVAAEPGHVAESGQRVERVAAHGFDEPAER